MSEDWDALLDRQTGALPRRLQPADRLLLKATEWSLVAIGSLFTVMVSLEVTSRYVLGFSTFFVSAATRFLLLWFFLLGAGLALRVGAHVGFELVLRAFGPRMRRAVRTFIQVLALIFFAEMTWGGLVALGPAYTQTESALNVSLVWGFLAVPVGFILLVYHMAILMIADVGPGAARGGPT